MKIKQIYDFLDKWIPKDGRWFLGGSHVLLFLVAWFFFGLQRGIEQILWGYLFTLATEFILYKVTDKYKGKSVWDRMFSAATEISGLIILIRSGHNFFYAITGPMAVMSKYLFRVNKNQHLFNPTNFAIVSGLCLFPATTFNLLTDEYARNTYPLIHVTVLGILAVWRGKTWPVTVGYLGMMLLYSLVHSLFVPGSFIYWFGPEIGAIGLIFLFLMITDPKTTPASISGKFVFGISVAVAKIILKEFEIIYPQFLALFIVTLIRGVLLLKEEMKAVPAMVDDAEK